MTEDEEKLREQARRSAQNALAKQREQTRVFDEGARERRLAASDASADISMSAAQRKSIITIAHRERDKEREEKMFLTSF